MLCFRKNLDNNKKKAIKLFFVFSLFIFLVIGNKFCQGYEIIKEAPSQENRFIVHPAKMEIDGFPGQKKEFNLIIVNRLGEQKTFFINKKGFDKEPRENETAEWIQLEQDEFLLSDSERLTTKIKVSIPEEISGGGYYLSLIVSTEGKENFLKDKVKLISQIEIPILIKIQGESLNEKAEVFFRVKRLFFLQGPITFFTHLKNKGNVHFQTGADISIFNFLGSQAAQLSLETPIIFPKEEKTVEIKWNKKFPIGFYRAKLNLNNFETGKIEILQKDIWFFVFPFHWLLILLLVSWLFNKIIKRLKEKYKLKFSLQFKKRK